MVALHCFWEERERVRSLPLSCIFCSQGCPIERFYPSSSSHRRNSQSQKASPTHTPPVTHNIRFFFSFLHSLNQAIPRKFASVFFWTTCRTVSSRSTGVIFCPFLFPRLSLLTHLLLSSLTCVIYYSSCFTYSLEGRGGPQLLTSPALSLHPLKYFHPLL